MNARRRLLVLTVISMTLTAVPGALAQSLEFSVQRGLQYGQHDGVKLTGDRYSPKAPGTDPADQASLDDTLRRIAQYVQTFERDFAIVISDEHYEQKEVLRFDPGRSTSLVRTLGSEMLFAWVPERQSWLTVRNVLMVDGASVPDSQGRLDAAFALPEPARLGRLRRLRDEGARFNVGRIYRNFNDPTLVLQFLDAENQSRFAFTVVGAEKANGLDAWKLSFVERSTPTLLQTNTGDLLSSGLVWVARSDGTVARTKLTLKDAIANTTADLLVDYGRNSKVGMVVPIRMAETYVQQRVANLAASGMPPRFGVTTERIECVARYSNFRRFETTGRVVVPR